MKSISIPFFVYARQQILAERCRRRQYVRVGARELRELRGNERRERVRVRSVLDEQHAAHAVEGRDLLRDRGATRREHGDGDLGVRNRSRTAQHARSRR
jgi:hypothetical protein